MSGDERDGEKREGRSRSRSPGPKKVASLMRGYAIYISGISSRTSASEVEKRFEKAGTVNGVQLVDDPRTKEFRGFAFVYYDTESDAVEAVKLLNGQELDGRFIQVARAKRDRPRTPTPGEYLGNDRHTRAEPPRSRSSRDSYRGERDKSPARDRDRERDDRRDRPRERSPVRRSSSYDRDRDRDRDDRRDDRDRRRSPDRR